MEDKRTIEITKSQAPAGAQTSGGRSVQPSPFGLLRREIDRLFDDFGLPDFSFPMIARFPVLDPTRQWAGVLGTTPAMDLLERDTEYEIQAELPGLDPSDVEIRLSEGMLTIRGEKTTEYSEEDVDFHRRERSYGAFQRMLRLPRGVNADDISAKFENGVLTVHLPKTAEARESERKIEVTAG
jgi:HSP20 family protein